MLKICQSCQELKKHYSKGLCERCYNRYNSRRWRKNNPIREKEIRNKYRSKSIVKQNMYDYCKNYRKKYPEVSRQISKRMRKKYPHRIKARNAVANAIRKGILLPPFVYFCSCGEQANQYHHYLGYDKENWLKVIPLCRKHHRITDKMVIENEKK